MDENKEHILVCISASSSSSIVIKEASKMAEAFKARLTALYIESRPRKQMNKEDQISLEKNLKLARQCGARVEILSGQDVAFQIIEYARLSNVSRIILGRSPLKKIPFIGKPDLVEQLLQRQPSLDIYIIPVLEVSPVYPKEFSMKFSFNVVKDVIKSILILVSITVMGYLFQSWGFSEANIITIYILGVLLTAITTSSKVYSLLTSIVSVLVFNFFFTKPHFTFHAYESGYPVTFLIMFLAAFITSTLAINLQQSAKKSAQIAYRTQILLETNQLLQKETTQIGLMNVICLQLVKLLQKNVVFYLINQEQLDEPVFFPYLNAKIDKAELLKEKEIANWVYQNNDHAGASTNKFSQAHCLYFAVRSNEHIYGVVGIDLENEQMDSFVNNFILSLLGEAGLAFESEYANRQKVAADLRAENEKMHANLLRTISHDLRTPLTSILGNTSILQTTALDEKQKQELYTTISEDAQWLISLVENLLSASRLDQEQLHLILTSELMDELINEALNHVKSRIKDHHLIYEPQDDLLLVKVDPRLIIQVIVNLIDNAIKYTPSDSTIWIRLYEENQQVVVEVEDNGPGVSDEIKEHVFDMFYTGNKKTADSQRSLGLGLALCKMIVEVHGGTIGVRDTKDHGALFYFTLPIEEVNLNG